MRQRTTRAQEVYETNDIIHGFGEVPAVETEKGLGWMLPGRAVTYLKEEAESYARKMDDLIRYSMTKVDRSLIW